MKNDKSNSCTVQTFKTLAKCAAVLLFLFVFVSGVPRPASAAHTLDAAPAPPAISVANPVTWSITTGTGATVLVLGINALSATARTAGTPTFNGVAMTQAGTTQCAGETCSEVWYLLNPSIGTFNISIPNAATSKSLSIAAASFKSGTGVSAFDVSGGAVDTPANDPQVSVTTTAAGDAVFGIMGHGNTNVTTCTPNQISIVLRDDGTAGYGAQYALPAAAGAIAVTWSATPGSCGTGGWGEAVAAFKEGNAVTVGNGASEPANATVAPGSGIVDLDAFTVKIGTGTDTVTALTVTLAPASSNTNIAQVDITDASNVAKCTAVTNPATTTVSFTGCTIGVTTTETAYKIRITPKTHAAMNAPPGASYATTGTVTAVTTTLTTRSYQDTTSATITVDNASPTTATATSGAIGNTYNTLGWTASASADIAESVVLRWTAAAAGADVPVEGTAYSVGNAIGTATVVCVLTSTTSQVHSGIINGTGAGAGCSATALTNGTAYSYKVFSKDSNGNYDAGISTNMVNLIPNGLTVGNGASEPTSQTIGPAAAVVDLDNFTLATSSGTDNVTGITVTLAPASSNTNIGQVDITDTANVAKCTAATNPASTTVALTGCTITANTTVTTYKVRITPKTHAAMPAVPGAAYATTGTVTAITSTLIKAYNDTTSATITVDNESPVNATSQSATPGNLSNTLNWTASSSADIAQSVILRWAAAAPSADKPVEGTAYTAGTAIGTATVACVLTSTASQVHTNVLDGTAGATAGCTTANLTNGTTYVYKVYQKDSRGNYDAGVVTNTVVPNVYTIVGNGGTPSDKFVGPSQTTNNAVDSFTLYTSSGTDTVTAITITRGGTGADADVAASGVKVYLDAGTANELDGADTVQGAGCTFAAGVCTISGLSIAVNTTPKNFIIAYNTAASLSAHGNTLAGTVTAITATNTKTYSDTASSTLTIDIQGPTYTWTSPADGQYYGPGGSFTATATTSDANAGITAATACNTKIDGAAPAGGVFSTTPASITYASPSCSGTVTITNPTSLTEGNHNLTFTVADSVGNSTTSASKVIYVDKTAPVITSASASGGTTVVATFTEAGSGLLPGTGANGSENTGNYVLKTGVTCGSGTVVTVSGAVRSGTDVTLTVAAMTDLQQYNLTVSNVRDNVANTMTAGCVTFTYIANAAPTAVTDLSVVNSAVRALSLKWTEPTDADGSVASYEFKYIDAYDYAANITTATLWTSGYAAAKEPTPSNASGSVTSFPISCADNGDNVTCVGGAVPTVAQRTSCQSALCPNTLFYTTMKSVDNLGSYSNYSNFDPTGAASSLNPSANSHGTTKVSHTALKYGWNYVSVPYAWDGVKSYLNVFDDDTGTSAGSTVNIYRWDSTSATNPTTSYNWVSVANTTVPPATANQTGGKGFLISSPNFKAILDQYNSAGTAQLGANAATWIAVPLEPGINWIGNPWLKNANVNTMYICTYTAANAAPAYAAGVCSGANYKATRAFTAAQAVGDGMVGTDVYYMLGDSTFVNESHTTAKLRPWWGVGILVNNAAWTNATYGAGGAAPVDPDNKVWLIIVKP